MSTKALNDVLRRICDDSTFEKSFLDDPKSAIEGFDLTEAERNALLGLGESALEKLGGDPTKVKVVLKTMVDKCPARMRAT